MEFFLFQQHLKLFIAGRYKAFGRQPQCSFFFIRYVLPDVFRKSVKKYYPFGVGSSVPNQCTKSFAFAFSFTGDTFVKKIATEISIKYPIDNFRIRSGTLIRC